MTSKPPESTVNGPGVVSTGFHHALPQIAAVSRPTKLAQSKSSSKSDLAVTELSTSEVEGVGKVFHIGMCSLSLNTL